MVDQNASNKTSRKTPALPADAQAKIGEKLKALYDDVVNQPVPDRFKDLLSKLESGPQPLTPARPAEGAVE